MRRCSWDAETEGIKDSYFRLSSVFIRKVNGTGLKEHQRSFRREK